MKAADMTFLATVQGLYDDLACATGLVWTIEENRLSGEQIAKIARAELLSRSDRNRPVPVAMLGNVS